MTSLFLSLACQLYGPLHHKQKHKMLYDIRQEHTGFNVPKPKLQWYIVYFRQKNNLQHSTSKFTMWESALGGWL